MILEDTLKDVVSLRMLYILMQHVANEGAHFVYNNKTNTILYDWHVKDSKGGYAYTERGACQLDTWFSEKDQMYVIDLVMPRL